MASCFYATCCTQVFKLTDMKTLRKKSRLLTGYYELLLRNLAPDEPDADQEPQSKKKKPAGSNNDIWTIAVFMLSNS